MASVLLADCPPESSGPPVHSYRLTAPNSERTPKVVRDMIAALLTATDHLAVVEAARLLVSEVVTNVYQHAAACLLTVEATVSPESVFICVTDSDPRHRPSTQRSLPDTAAEHGRGLALVNALATRWGVSMAGEVERAGKSVWFVLDDGSCSLDASARASE